MQGWIQEMLYDFQGLQLKDLEICNHENLYLFVHIQYYCEQALIYVIDLPKYLV